MSAPRHDIVNNPAVPLAWELQYSGHMSILPVFAAAVLLAQTQPSTPAQKTDPNAPITMTGCVARDYTDSKNANSYTFIDNSDGSRYRLASKNNIPVGRYSGLNVQVVGIINTKNLSVAGGFWPSPNVAAQAGNIDVAQAAVAAMPGGPSNGVGNVSLPVLNISRLSLGQGECKK